MKIQQSLFGAALFMSLAISVGCGGSTTTSDNGTSGTATEDGKAIASVEITPEKATLSKGTTTKFRAIAHYADGTTKDITDSRDIVWNTSEPTVATVAKDGTVTTLKEGMVEISAEYKGEKATEGFAVLP
jgi:uncharacterized protein YjdB